MAEGPTRRVIRAFLDANVLFTAAHSRGLGGASWGIIELAGRRDDLIVMTTEYAFDEAERKLLKKSPESLGAFASLKPLLEMCPAPPSDLVRHVRWLIRDEKDRPIMAGAISAEADWLLTKDGNDFGHIYGVEVYGTLVTTPATGLYRFRQREGMP